MYTRLLDFLLAIAHPVYEILPITHFVHDSTSVFKSLPGFGANLGVEGEDGESEVWGQDGESKHLLISGHQWQSVRLAHGLVGLDTGGLVNVAFFVTYC